MTGPTVHNLHVHIGACAASKAFKEVLDEFTLQIANISHLHRRIHDARHPPAEINSGNSQRLIHWHQEIPRSQDSLLISHSLVKRFAEGDPNIFNRVVLIDVEISIAFKIEVESPMPRHKLQHVIKETDTGANVVGSRAF